MNKVCEDLATKALTRLENTGQVANLAQYLPHRSPEQDNHSIQCTGYIHRVGNRWGAYLIISCEGSYCRYYEQCLNNNCRSRTEAQIVLEYGKQVAQINHNGTLQMFNTSNLNLN